MGPANSKVQEKVFRCCAPPCLPKVFESTSSTQKLQIMKKEKSLRFKFARASALMHASISISSQDSA